MEKTFSKKWIKGKKFFYYFPLILVLFALMQILSGCTSGEVPHIDADRQKDSLGVYTAIDKALLQYKQSLSYNESQKNDQAKESFEATLNILKKVDNRVSDNPKNSVWKKDYADLTKSVCQDYLYSQSNISEKSQVFKFAKKYGVEFETDKQTEEVSSEEPLPDGSDVPLVRNKAVEEYIDFFSKTDRGRGFIDKSLYRSGKYFPIMRKILRYHGAPEELIYLSVQESGLNPTIVSRAGAVGLWQFMPSTGNMYGLYSDGYRDDRRDFEKSTDAAARHLKDLYRSFGDWYLAFAAYNAGPGRIKNGISKSGSNNFWDIRSYLPGETKNYVPSILAISYILRSPDEYGFKDIQYGEAVTFDRINIKGELSLQRVAEMSGSDIETVRDLNSELTTDNVPNYDVPYQLRIPNGSYKTFLANYKKSDEYNKNGKIEPIYIGNENKGFVTEKIASVNYKLKNYDPGEPSIVGVSTGKKKLTYTYRGNENLGSIADSFYVRPTDLRMWNNIPFGTSPKQNQMLDIYLSKKMYNKFYGIVEVEKKDTVKIQTPDTITTRKERVKVDLPTEETKTDNKKKTEVTHKKETNKNSQMHVVKSGEMLSKIADDYDVTISDLKEWNNLKSDKILVGQKLKIYGDKKVVEKEKKVSKEKTKTTHTVQEGENLTIIADKYDVTVADIKDWNELDGDIITPGQKLIVAEPKKKNTKDTKTSNKKQKTHTVKEGENLTMIADKYDVTVGDLKSWNDLSGSVIKAGQVLIVSEPKTKNKKEVNTKSKTYKVKKGDTLQSIADEFDVTIKELKKWNELEDNTITIGQVLKVTQPEKKKKK